MGKFLYIAVASSFISYIIVLGSFLKILTLSHDIIINILLVSALVIIAFFFSLISVKEAWYELATSYTPHEEFICRLKRVMSLSILGLCTLNMILLLSFALFALA